MIKKTNFAAPSYGRKRKPIFGERGRARFFSSLFIAPSLIGLLVFFVIPFVVIAYYSVIDNPVSGEFVGLDNFIKIWNNTAFRLAAKNTLTFSAVSVPLAVVLSLLLASSLLTDIPMKSRFRAFFLSPLMVPAASVVLVWQVLFHYNGALNDLVVFFGGAAQDWLKSPYSQLVIAALFLWKNLGYNMILFMSALSSIPKEQIESAQVDGAGKLTIFFKIKLRYLSSSILFVTILSLISSFKIFREIYLLTGNYPYETLYMLQHYMNNTFRSLDYQKLSAAALMLLVFMVAIIGLLFLVENRYGRDTEQ